jgi:hypothetical protein
MVREPYFCVFHELPRSCTNDAKNTEDGGFTKTDVEAIDSATSSSTLGTTMPSTVSQSNALKTSNSDQGEKASCASNFDSSQRDSEPRLCPLQPAYSSPAMWSPIILEDPKGTKSILPYERCRTWPVGFDEEFGSMVPLMCHRSSKRLFVRSTKPADGHCGLLAALNRQLMTPTAVIMMFSWV